jgi:hypothetical protein
MKTHIDVALILWNTDVIELASLVLCRRNLKSCGVEPCAGLERILDLIRTLGPRVVVFDLDPPYDRSAAVALHLMDRFPDRAFVITCADSALALKKAPWVSRFPLFEKPYEIEHMADTVRSMVIRARRSFSTLAIGTS